MKRAAEHKDDIEYMLFHWNETKQMKNELA